MSTVETKIISDYWKENSFDLIPPWVPSWQLGIYGSHARNIWSRELDSISCSADLQYLIVSGFCPWSVLSLSWHNKAEGFSCWIPVSYEMCETSGSLSSIWQQFWLLCSCSIFSLCIQGQGETPQAMAIESLAPNWPSAFLLIIHWLESITGHT